MIKRFSAIIPSLAVLALAIPVCSFANLSEQLRENNFNLYAAPTPANEMRLRDLNGGPLNLSHYRGKVVILNFWKIDCQPCAAEKAILEKIYRKYRERGLAIVAVDLFDPAERVQAYCSQGGFTFSFAVDTDKRFRVQQHRTGTGNPTAFVVNPGNEAIYEIPAVPTTYLINRQGQVVGNACGLVNWEEGSFSELLESLLGEAKHVPALARNSGDFARPAREGPRQQNTRDGAGIGQELEASHGVTNVGAPSAYTRVAQAPTLPFQPQQAPVPTVAPQPDAVAPSGPTTGPQPGTKAPSQRATHAPRGQSRKKPSPARAAPPAAPPTLSGQPQQPYGPPVTPGAVGPERPLPGVTAQRPGMAPGPAVPPVTQQAPAGPAPSSGRLMPLPPAVPYSPQGSRVPPAAPPLQPDSEGNVVARIPGQSGAPDNSGLVRPSGPGGLPQAQRIGGPKPLEGFIMDAFGQPRQAGMQAPAQPVPPQQPPSSVFGQLNQDLSALGTGIKDVFSRILPTR